MNNKIPKAIQLFLTFIKIGAFTFGGGYAMLPLIQKEIVEKKHWITDNDILEIVAISESTPGPIAINAATFERSQDIVEKSQIRKYFKLPPPAIID